MSGFSERAFEFAFNAELCQKNKSMLVTCPNLPSQREEKKLGYDVQFMFEKPTYCYSLFLQHKVSSYAQRRQHNNIDYYDAHNGAYFKFKVDTEQHNTLIQRSGGGNFYYCAPLFSNFNELQDHYNHESIVENSTFINPFGTRINDNLKHNITYDKGGSAAFLHSNPRKLKVLAWEEVTSGDKVKVDKDYINRLSFEIKEYTSKTALEKRVSSIYNNEKNELRRIQSVLAQVLGISWILVL